MEVNVEQVSELTTKITVTLPAEDVQKKLGKEYDKLQKESKMKGFRRGKVPRSIIVKNYEHQVKGEVGEKLVQDTYFDVIEKEKIEPVVHPEFEPPKYNDDGSFTYVAQVDIKPEFELQDYKGLEVEKPNTDVTDEEVSEELDRMRKEMAALRSVEDRAIQDGDIAIVDFQGYHEGEAMKQVQNDNYSVDVGSGKMGPEFEEKLLGMNKDEEATHEVDFPEKYPNPVLAGKKIEFRVKVKDIKERVLADLDDEFAKDVGQEFDSFEALQIAIKSRLQNEKNDKSLGELTDKVMQKLLEKHDFEVPERLVRFEVEEMIKQTEQSLEQSGMSLESAGINKEELAENNKPVAVQRVRGDFILKKIAEVEDIKVVDEDLERGFKRIGDQYNMPVAKVKEFFQSRDDLLPFMNELLNEKILIFLRDEANLIDPVPVADEAASEKD